MELPSIIITITAAASDKIDQLLDSRIEELTKEPNLLYDIIIPLIVLFLFFAIPCIFIAWLVVWVIRKSKQ
ncbi:hypothetical protein [Dysgonomonas macrotermitis]|nr:hypothetical protein [Dysgonomonas macrotermitis]